MSNAPNREAAKRLWERLRPLINRQHSGSTRPALPGSARFHDEAETKHEILEALAAQPHVVIAALAFYIKTDAQRRTDVEENAARWEHIESHYPYGGHPSKGFREHIRTAVDRERGMK